MAKVIVCGSINMDIVARVAYHPVPGETISGINQNYYPGGKGANQAVASALSGCNTVMVGNIGDDGFGVELKQFLTSKGVDTNNISTDESLPTGTALIAVDDKGENIIIINAGSNGALFEKNTERVNVDSDDVVVAQFETPIATTKSIFAKAQNVGAKTILNPAPAVVIDSELLELTNYLIVNETELGIISKTQVSISPTDEEMILAIKNLRELGFDGVVVLTLGSRGVIAFEKESQIIVDPLKVNVVDTTGAGDCFTGNLAASLCAENSLADSLMFANAAAGISVERNGAGPSMPTRSEVEAKLI